MRNRLFGTIIVSLCIMAAAALPAKAQTNTPPANAGSGTNAVAVVNAVFNLLPAYNPLLTNTYAAKEVEINSGPLWKTINASGSTPYLSISADYWFASWLAGGAEFNSLGNGQGNNAVDSVLANLSARYVSGNLALGAMVGAGDDVNNRSFMAAAGPYVEIRYLTGADVRVDTRGVLETGKRGSNGSMTRVMLGFRL